jgi:hypothetical protein
MPKTFPSYFFFELCTFTKRLKRPTISSKLCCVATLACTNNQFSIFTDKIFIRFNVYCWVLNQLKNSYFSSKLCEKMLLTQKRTFSQPSRCGLNIITWISTAKDQVCLNRTNSEYRLKYPLSWTLRKLDRNIDEVKASVLRFGNSAGANKNIPASKVQKITNKNSGTMRRIRRK